MKVVVYYGRFMLAQETVDSADMAWQRGTEICRQLSSRDMARLPAGLAWAGSGLKLCRTEYRRDGRLGGLRGFDVS